MKAKFTRLRSRFTLLIFSLGLIVVGQTWAQNSTIDYEKATLVSKFAKYVNWPAEARQRTFVIGVYEDTEKHSYFSDFFANKGVKGKDISVRLIESISEAKNVNILYIPASKQRNLAKLSDRVISASHVLIITEDAKDISKTMIDISFNRQQSQISFKVIEPNFDDAKLAVPELSYFVDNKNNEEILTESPTFKAQQKQKSELSSLQNQIEQQKISLQQLNEKLDASQESSEKYYLALQQQAERLKLVQKEDDNKKQELKSQNRKLEKLTKQLQEQKSELEIAKQLQNQETQSTSTEQAFPVIDNEKIEAQEKTITELTEKLNEQRNIANNNAIKLANMTKESEAQSSYQTLFYVFLLLALAASVIAFLMWKKAQSAESQASSAPSKAGNDILPLREEQLVKSENIAALGYIASDITYAVGISLEELQAQFESAGETKNATTLKPVVELLENFNLIAADQDDTKPQNFDVIDYIKKMLALYDFEFSQSDIAYSYAGEKALTIKSVPSYIALALLHIINNSLKHGFNNDGNGKISLKVEKGVKSGAKITFSDDGKGMSKTTLENMFKPFYTTRSDRGYVGTGMSTTYDLIKKKLAGDIKVDSKEGKGTTITISLP